MDIFILLLLCIWTKFKNKKYHKFRRLLYNFFFFFLNRIFISTLKWIYLFLWYSFFFYIYIICIYLCSRIEIRIKNIWIYSFSFFFVFERSLKIRSIISFEDYYIISFYVFLNRIFISTLKWIYLLLWYSFFYIYNLHLFMFENWNTN